MKRIFGSVALALVAALTLAACGSNDSSSSSSSSAGSASSDFDKADVTFAQSMIPHHQQAVRMAKMARLHASTSQVKQLAVKIAAAQGPEIDTMTGWLKDWGQKAPSGSMNGMGGRGHGMGSMPGMMSSQQMKGLGSATGATFDRMWLTMMMKHHRGAVAMAKTEQATGKNVDAVALAKKIEAAQTAEISQMKSILGAS